MHISYLPIAVLFTFCADSALAVVLSGPGGRGVPVGNSSLIGTADYGDTFTGTADGGNNPARVYAPAIQPAAAYGVESTYANPPVNFTSQSTGSNVAEFSFAADGAGTPGLVNGTPNYPGTSGAGSATGFTQTGGGGVDYGVPYGFRPRYVVQFDGVLSGDRMDITSGPVPGTIFAANSLSVFIRGTGGASLFNGSVDTPIPGYNTGLTNDGQWHNYAAIFDQTLGTLEVFVDEQSKGIIDLTTFAGGLYQNFSNANVGVGAGMDAGQDRIWTDNFQVGAPIPEPASIGLMMGAAGLLTFQRRRRA